MAIKWANNATTTIASGISSGSTTITVAGGTGSLFPTAGGADYFYATLNDSSNNIEIVKVTGRSGDVMTVVRGQDGTTAQAFIGGDKFELRPTAAGLAAASSGGTKCIGVECIALAAAGEDVDYVGASGEIELDENGDPTASTYDIWTTEGDSNPVLKSVDFGS